MDLRDRLARVAAARAVLRDVEGRTLKGDDPSTVDVGVPDGDTRPATGQDVRRAPYSTSEERHDLRGLGLEVVGLTDPDPLTLAHLGLRGEPPRRWEDVVFLDTETTGLS
ncbi:MAG: hypothetical protein AAB284_06920, partial [Chloroflexota bacterium]